MIYTIRPCPAIRNYDANSKGDRCGPISVLDKTIDRRLAQLPSGYLNSGLKIYRGLLDCRAVPSYMHMFILICYWFRGMTGPFWAGKRLWLRDSTRKLDLWQNVVVEPDYIWMVVGMCSIKSCGWSLAVLQWLCSFDIAPNKVSIRSITKSDLMGKVQNVELASCMSSCK